MRSPARKNSCRKDADDLITSESIAPSSWFLLSAVPECVTVSFVPEGSGTSHASATELDPTSLFMAARFFPKPESREDGRKREIGKCFQVVFGFRF